MIILYLILYSAGDKNVTYIVDFSSLQSEKKNSFDHSLSPTLFSTLQKCDIHCRFFRFLE